jgi:hypothetical protein
VYPSDKYIGSSLPLEIVQAIDVNLIMTTVGSSGSVSAGSQSFNIHTKLKENKTLKTT